MTRFISEENKLSTQSLLLYCREKTEDSLLHTCRHTGPDPWVKRESRTELNLPFFFSFWLSSPPGLKLPFILVCLRTHNSFEVPFFMYLNLFWWDETQVVGGGFDHRRRSSAFTHQPSVVSTDASKLVSAGRRAACTLRAGRHRRLRQPPKTDLTNVTMQSRAAVGCSDLVSSWNFYTVLRRVSVQQSRRCTCTQCHKIMYIHS